MYTPFAKNVVLKHCPLSVLLIYIFQTLILILYNPIEKKTPLIAQMMSGKIALNLNVSDCYTVSVCSFK